MAVLQLVVAQALMLMALGLHGTEDGFNASWEGDESKG